MDSVIYISLCLRSRTSYLVHGGRLVEAAKLLHARLCLKDGYELSERELEILAQRFCDLKSFDMSWMSGQGAMEASQSFFY